MPITVRIDEAVCNGYGNCVMAAPAVFDLDPATNIAVVLPGHPVEADEPAIDDAIADCPVQAILASRT
ncbi:ferredoxin [Jatrophihabitans sp. YIM 134969]